VRVAPEIMLTDTDRQTDRHTDTHKDVLVTILHNVTHIVACSINKSMNITIVYITLATRRQHVSVQNVTTVPIHGYVNILSELILNQLECGPMPNVMVALPNIGGALCSTPQSLADAHY